LSFSGLRSNGYVLVGSVRSFARPLPGGPLLGAHAAATAIALPESLASAIRARFPNALGDANMAAARPPVSKSVHA
jgi:hypothetical protein